MHEHIPHIHHAITHLPASSFFVTVQPTVIFSAYNVLQMTSQVAFGCVRLQISLTVLFFLLTTFHVFEGEPLPFAFEPLALSLLD